MNGKTDMKRQKTPAHLRFVNSLKMSELLSEDQINPEART